MGNVLDEDNRLLHERSEDPLEYSKDWSDRRYLFYKFRHIQPKENTLARQLQDRMNQLRNIDRSMENAWNQLKRFDSEVFEGYNNKMSLHLLAIRNNIVQLRKEVRNEAAELDALFRLSCSE